MTLCDKPNPLYLLMFFDFWNILLQSHKVLRQTKRGVSGRADGAVGGVSLNTCGNIEQCVSGCRIFAIMEKADYTGM